MAGKIAEKAPDFSTMRMASELKTGSNELYRAFAIARIEVKIEDFFARLAENQKVKDNVRNFFQHYGQKP